MKNLLFSAVLSLCFVQLSAQEALLSDLLNVAPVEFSEEGSEEMNAEYQEKLDDERAKLDDDLAKLDESYKKDVGGDIDGFNKVLEKMDEKEVANEKQRMITRVRTMTMSLKKNKKDAVMQFKNSMVKEIRELPMKYQQKKEKEVEAIRLEYAEKFEQEYEMNMKVLETFKKTQHLVKKDTPVGSTDSSDN